jgi:hypothetical protein
MNVQKKVFCILTLLACSITQLKATATNQDAQLIAEDSIEHTILEPSSLSKQSEATSKKPQKKKRAEAVYSQDSLYVFHFSFSISEKLVSKQIKVGVLQIKPVLRFSFIDKDGNPATTRFGQFFDLPADLTDFVITTPTTGPYFLDDIDCNVQGSGIKFPIRFTEQPYLNLFTKIKAYYPSIKGMGPLSIPEGAMHAYFIISLGKSNMEQSSDGFYRYKTLRITQTTEEDYRIRRM